MDFISRSGLGRVRSSLAGLAAVLLVACATPPAADTAPAASPAPDPSRPPVAAQHPYEVRAPHGAVRNDPYYWLRDDTRENPEMLAYLNAENAWTDAQLAPLAGLETTLRDEMTARIPPQDQSVPVFDNGYWYYSRFEPGAEHRVYLRRKGTQQAPEEIILDAAARSQGHGFYALRGLTVSLDNRYLAFAEDTVGRRQYDIRIRDLSNGKLLPDVVTGAQPDLVWAADGKTLLYIENDPETLLGHRIKAHRIGTDAKQDRLLYDETDPSFYLGLMRTRDDAYVCIQLRATVSTEQRCTPAQSPGEFTALAPRQRDFEYRADRLDGRWVILTNWDAQNFRLMSANDAAWGDRAKWVELLAQDPDVLLEDFTLFDGAIAVADRTQALTRLRIIDADGKQTVVAADEPAYTMWLDENPDPGSRRLRYGYMSQATPETTYEIDLDGSGRRLLKQEAVPGYDPDAYVTERVWATARDGTRIPVSLLHRRDFVADGTAALLQDGYGAYGFSNDPWFDPAVLSLVDRGMVYAIAHIRGGSEMGRAWYEAGKLRNKPNSFTDFIDVTDALVTQGYAAPRRIAAIGGSAGGLLMGAVSNLAPEKYGVIVAQVPFVDVVTTMLDASIPLTTNEYDEWGNPADPATYDFLLGYSPYDNVRATDYPAMFVTTGLWDSQVQYYEPAKWVARLRERGTGDAPLLFRIDMQAGHGGKAGRFEKYDQTAEIYAFVMTRLGVSGAAPAMQ